MIAAASAAMAAITLRRGRERPGAGVGGARLDAGGTPKGEGESDGVPRSSFMQVQLATQSEQLSKGRKVFEEVSSFAKERSQIEEKTAHSRLRASRLAASEYEIYGGTLQRGLLELRRFCANESRQHSILARQMQDQFHQPLEQAMSRHADVVMRAKVGVQRSAQLVQESENRLRKAKRQLAKAQNDEKYHREALLRGHQDNRASRKDVDWLKARAARALDSARHAESVVLGERHQLLQAMKARDEALTHAARQFEAAERERAVTVARTLACFAARQRDFYAAQMRDLGSLLQVVEALDPEGDVDLFIRDRKTLDNAPFYRVALSLLDWASVDQPPSQPQQPQQQQKDLNSDVYGEGTPAAGGGGERGGGGGSGAVTSSDDRGGDAKAIDAILRRLIPDQQQRRGGKKVTPRHEKASATPTVGSGVQEEAGAESEKPLHEKASDVPTAGREGQEEAGAEPETGTGTEAEIPTAESTAESEAATTATTTTATGAATAQGGTREGMESVGERQHQDSRARDIGFAGLQGRETSAARGVSEDGSEPSKAVQAARRELGKLVRSENGRNRFLQALNERRSEATEVTPEAYDALVEILRVFLDGCAPRRRSRGSRDRRSRFSSSSSSTRSGSSSSSSSSTSRSRGRSRSHPGEGSPSPPPSSSFSIPLPLGGSFVGSSRARGDVSNRDKQAEGEGEDDDQDLIIVEEGGEDQVLLRRSRTASADALFTPAAFAPGEAAEEESEEEDRKRAASDVRGVSAGLRGGPEATALLALSERRAAAALTGSVSGSTTSRSSGGSVEINPTRQQRQWQQQQQRNASGGNGKHILDFTASIVRGEPRGGGVGGSGGDTLRRGAGPAGGGSTAVLGARGGGGGAGVGGLGSRVTSRFGSSSLPAVTSSDLLASRHELDHAVLREVVEAALGRGARPMMQHLGSVGRGGRGGRGGSGGKSLPRGGWEVTSAADGGPPGVEMEGREEGEMDIRCARQAMILANTFYKIDESIPIGLGGRPERTYLLRQLRDHPLWKYPRFWDEALMMGVKEQLLEGPAMVRWDDLQGEARRDAVARTHNVVFSQLASIAFNMLECGVEGARVRSEVTRKCRESQLGEAQMQELLRDLNRRIQKYDQDPRGVDRLLSWCADVEDGNAPSSTHSPEPPPQSVSTTPSAPGVRSGGSGDGDGGMGGDGNDGGGANVTAVEDMKIGGGRSGSRASASPPDVKQPQQQQQHQQKGEGQGEGEENSLELEFVREAAALAESKRRLSSSAPTRARAAPVSTLMPLEVEASPGRPGVAAAAAAVRTPGAEGRGDGEISMVAVDDQSGMTDEDEYDML